MVQTHLGAKPGEVFGRHRRVSLIHGHRPARRSPQEDEHDKCHEQEQRHRLHSAAGQIPGHPGASLLSSCLMIQVPREVVPRIVGATHHILPGAINVQSVVEKDVRARSGDRLDGPVERGFAPVQIRR